jgi:subtilase family serine protease
MVSAICPNCSILLVEASSSSMANLGAAVNEAAKLGATEISNSYGGSDSSGDASSDAYYNHPGIAITASSGDNGYGVEYPAASPYVTAAGGTSLTGSVSTSWSETAWSGAGSGCSKYESQPSWQQLVPNITGACSGRAVADVSAVADPNTGVSVYDTYSYQGYSGWMVFGGTSVASPIIASVYALAGNAATIGNGYPYSNASSLHDVQSGSNGSCSGSALCTAGAGWDGPTGLGTPNGTGAF